MIFYHMSKTIRKSYQFVPRVPEKRCYGENSSVERICVAKDYEHCLIGLGGEINIDDIFWVHQFDVHNFVYKPTKQLVPDSHFTQEFWLIKPTVSTLIDIIKIKSFDIWDIEGTDWWFYRNFKYESI